MTFSPSLPGAPGGPCMNDMTQVWEGLSGYWYEEKGICDADTWTQF